MTQPLTTEAPIRHQSGNRLFLSVWNSRQYVRIVLVALAALDCCLELWPQKSKLELVGAAAALIGAYPIIREALTGVLRRHVTTELSMTIAVMVAALLINQVSTALVLVLCLLLTHTFELLIERRVRQSIRDLFDLIPDTAEVRSQSGMRCTSVADVLPGNTILVRPGQRIPVDGEVLAGKSFVDETPITGRSVPVEKVQGTRVYAGTLNASGVLEVHVKSVGVNTAFGKIVSAVTQEQSCAPLQKTADRISWYAGNFALAAALLTFLATRDATVTISVIILVGACGVAKATSLAILSAIGQAARRGAIIKGGLYLEQLARVDTAVLDKIATISVTEIVRSNASHAIRQLSRMQIETYLLTEDCEEISQGLAQRLGVDRVEAELFPDDKACKVAGLRSRGRTVVMIGNGIEDAPALTTADVGVAIDSGTDVSNESANVALLGNDLQKIVEIIQIAQCTKRIIIFDFAGTLLVSGVGIVLALSGRLNPGKAALIYLTSALVFLLNSARIRPSFPRRA